MSTRQAKVSIGLDYKPLRKDVQEAKKMLSDIGNAKIDPALRNSLRKMLDRDVQIQVDIYKRKIMETTAELKKLGAASSSAIDTGAIKKAVKDLSEYQSAVRSLGGGGGSGGGGGGGGSGMMSKGKGLFSGIRGAAAAIGVGLGVGASLARSEGRARTGMEVRQLTGGNTVGGSSTLGFTDMERRERALDIVRQTGRDIGQPEITSMVDQSEKFERAYGISGSQYSGALGAARRGGVQDQQGFIAGAIGDAVANKLSGSSVGEYLAAMTDFLGSMSKGVDVRQDSLRGFASALGSLDFFRRDSSRLFDAMGKLNNLFKGGGDDYQNYATYSAIETMGGGAEKMGLAAIELRRGLGMFGGGGDLAKKAEKLGMPDLANSLNVNGEDVMNKFLEDAFKTSTAAGSLGGKMDNNSAALMFREITGMGEQASIEQFLDMKGRGGKVSGKNRAALKEAMQSPEERQKKVMSNFDASVVLLSKRIDDVKNIIADSITGGVLSLAGAADEFADATGMFRSDTSKFAVAVAMFAGAKLAGAGGFGGFGGGRSPSGGEGGGSAPGIGLVNGVGAVLSAAAVGMMIGSAIREQLDAWTEDGWSQGVQKFWEFGFQKMGSNYFGGQVDEKMKERDKFGGGGELVSALRKSGVKNPTPEQIDEVMGIRQRMFKEKKDLMLQGIGAGGTYQEPSMPTVDEVMKEFEANQKARKDDSADNSTASLNMMAQTSPSGAGASLPGSINLDSGLMEGALSGNTEALLMLGKILTNMGGGAATASIQRGPAGARYG